MILYNSPILNQLLKKGKEEKIGRWFGKDLEMHSQELEKQREIMLPKEGIKGLVWTPCDVFYKEWQADHLLFLI